LTDKAGQAASAMRCEEEAGEQPRVLGSAIALRAAGIATDAATGAGAGKGKAKKEKPGPSALAIQERCYLGF